MVTSSDHISDIETIFLVSLCLYIHAVQYLFSSPPCGRYSRKFWHTRTYFWGVSEWWCTSFCNI